MQEQAVPLPAAIQRICSCPGGNDKPSPDNPIFVLAAGWRTGSTLLQRLIISSKQTMIWGEPFGPAAMVNFMTEPLRRIPRELFADRFVDVNQPIDRSELSADLSGKWIANLYPTLDFLQDAHVKYWQSMLGEPARKLGFERWGFKDVRLSVDHAWYLKWLFPNARFLFLYRNPFDAYISYRSFGKVWYHTWPERPLLTADDFGRHWNQLASGFTTRAAEVGALIVCFEQLISQESVVQQIEQYLQLPLDRCVLGQRIGAQKNGYQLSLAELQGLERSTSPTMQRLGYAPPVL